MGRISGLRYVSKLMSKKVIVIGAGAAGLMCAGKCAERGHDVTLFEKNSRVGRKLMITGKGRCNVTNYCTSVSELLENIPENGKFLYSAFGKCMPCDIMTFFEDMGAPLKVERGNRVFPESDKAVDIVDALKRYVDRTGVNIINLTVKDIITENGKAVGVTAENGSSYYADAVVVATGGLSYPLTGSTGDGYKFAEKTGHTVTPLRPSLVGLKCQEGWCEGAAGLSLKNVALKIEDTVKSKIIYTDFGEMLITHVGVSGPMILSGSAHLRNMENGRYILHIDLKPALSEEKLEARLIRELSENGSKAVKSAVLTLVPSSIVGVILKKSGLAGSEKCGNITKTARQQLLRTLKDLTLTVKDFCPIDEAIVTSGGVSVKDIDPKNMMSKKIQDLYFIGEVIDVDGYTGGFNLTIAFSTGYLAGMSI